MTFNITIDIPKGVATPKNDTHGADGEGWIGFDLDGTLAVYDSWKGIQHIGDPIAPMVERIKLIHNSGKKVKILTARVAPRENPTTYEGHDARYFIENWCMKNLGFVPEITHCKDHLMLQLFDDRTVQVVQNKGITYAEIIDQVFDDNDRLMKQVWRERFASRVEAFMAGVAFTICLTVIGFSLYYHFNRSSDDVALEELHNSATRYMNAHNKFIETISRHQQAIVD